MKNENQNDMIEKKKNTPDEELVSTLIKYLNLALLGAVILNLLLILVILPIFNGNNLWLTILFNIAPYLLIFIIVPILFRKKMRYLKTLQKGSEFLAKENFETFIPIQGNNELTDIAENINTIHHLYEAKTKAESLAKLENHHIITSISNEIHSPLTSIIGYLERIQSPNEHDPEKKKAYIETAVKKAYLVKGFIDELFEHAFTDNGKGYYQFKVYPGMPLINKLLAAATRALEEAGFVVVLENCIERDFSLWVDLEQLQRIFDYLVSNIIKYADPAKPVDFGLILNKNELCIIQRNKTNYSSETPGKTVIETAGSSLDSCRKIISRHQGRIDYYQLNQLFKVELVLPIHQ